jgi:hypothetical protein
VNRDHETRQRQEQQRGWHEIHKENCDSHWTRPRPVESGKCVGGGETEHQGDCNHEEAHPQRVPEECQERCVLKEVHHVFAGRWQVVQEGVVVPLIKVRALFECGDQRPQEWTGTNECGRNGGEVHPHTRQPVTDDCAAPKGVDRRSAADPLIGRNRIDGCHLTTRPCDGPHAE